MENGYSLCPKTTKELLVTNDSYFIPEPSCNKPTSNIIGLPCWRYTILNKSLEIWVWNVKPKLWYLNLLVMAHLASSEAHHLWSIIVSISALLSSRFWFAERLGSTCTGTSSPVLHFKTFVERKTAPSWWISDLARFERRGPEIWALETNERNMDHIDLRPRLEKCCVLYFLLCGTWWFSFMYINATLHIPPAP